MEPNQPERHDLKYIRPYLQRRLSHRPYLKWIFYYGFALGFLLTLSPVLRFLPASEIFSFQIGSQGFLMSFLGLMLLILLQFFFRPLAFSEVSVNDQGIRIDKFGSSESIPFSDVEKVTFELRHVAGAGFTLRLKKGRSIHLSLNLERGEYILETLAHFNLNLFNVKELEEYRRMLILYDHSNARLSDSLKKPILLLGKYLAVPVVITFCHLFLNSSLSSFPFELQVVKVLSSFLGFFILNSLIGLFLFFGADLHLRWVGNKVLKSSPRSVIRDTAYEKIVLKKAQVVYGFFLLLILVSVYFFPRMKFSVGEFL